VAEERSSVTELISDLVGQVTDLVRTEILLARTEMAEKANVVAGAGGLLAAGAALLLGALFLLLQWLVTLLVAAGLSVGTATLIIAVVAAIGGYLVLRAGLSKMTAASLKPERTIQSLDRDAQVAKEQVK